MRDPSGKLYSPTYPTRARGLVKRGRARWIGKDAIELIAPPEEDREETTNMTEDLNKRTVTPLEGKEYTTQDLIDGMVAIMKASDAAREVVAGIKILTEHIKDYQDMDAKEIFYPLNTLAEGFKENQRYALAIIERMYKGLHPEAYDPPAKKPGTLDPVYAAIAKRLNQA